MQKMVYWEMIQELIVIKFILVFEYIDILIKVNENNNKNKVIRNLNDRIQVLILQLVCVEKLLNYCKRGILYSE